MDQYGIVPGSCLPSQPRLCARGGGRHPQGEFEELKDKVVMGAERKSLVMTGEEKLRSAYHEGTLAIVGL